MKIIYLIRFLLIVLVGIVPTEVYADWNPFIVHYDTNQYGEGTHTWELQSHNGGWLYVANEGGLFQFDGFTWVRNVLPNHSPVRSVCIDSLNHRIYTGGINQIGYFKSDGFGQLSYTSLFDVTFPDMSLLNNIWKIDQVGSVLYFRGDRGVMRYSEQLSFHEIIEAPAKITASAIVGGSLYIGCRKGIYVLVDNKFHKLHGTEHFKGHLIRSITSSKSGTLILTSDALYVYDGMSVKPFISELNDYLLRDDAFCMVVRGNTIAIGTINRGVLICQLESENRSNLDSSQKNPTKKVSSQKTYSPSISLKFINEKNGLQNNTVLSLCFDADGMLWAGLDRGVDFILLASPLTNLYTFPDSYGTGYTSVKYKGQMYFGTNRGVYLFDKENDEKSSNKLIEIPNSSGQVWKLTLVGDDLFCLHDKGVFLIEKNKMKSIGITDGTLDLIALKGNNRALLAHYSGLSLIERKKGDKSSSRWIKLHSFPKINNGYSHIVMMPDSTIWAADMYSISHLRFDKDWSKLLSDETISYGSISKDISGVSIDVYNGKLRLATNCGLYYYDEISKKFIQDTALEKNLGGETNYRFVTGRGNRLWTLSHQILKVCDLYPTTPSDTLSYPSSKPSSKLSYNSVEQFPLNSHLDFVTRKGSCVWFGNDSIILPYDKGFALLDMIKAKSQIKSSLQVRIEQFYITYPEKKLVYRHHIGKEISSPKIPWVSNYLEITIGTNRVGFDTGIEYRYRFENTDDWSAWTKDNVKEYAGLYEGDYKLLVQARGVSGKIATDTFSFSILPPWWRTVTAYCIYILLFIGLIVVFYLLEKNRLKKHLDAAENETQRRIEEQDETHRQEQEDKQKVIMQLEKENLQYDLLNKRQEVTNLLLNSAKQNELMEELKADLHKVQLAVHPNNIKELRQRLLILTNRIDTNMKNKEVLERVEDEFNMLHNNFMDNLKQKHPDLNQNERMMCIYIRMHLSSKEIAPLLNISTRGVETIRYRLRRKFNLHREDSLSKFLKSLEQENESI